MREAVIYDDDLYEARDELGAQIMICERLEEQGISFRFVGVNARKIDEAYRIEIDPAFEVWRDAPNRMWHVKQSLKNEPVKTA